MGHNIGLETEERWLDESADTVRAGMVINIELYSLAETGEQIGNEETYLITERRAGAAFEPSTEDPRDRLKCTSLPG